jgi:hypothetical protein
MGRMFTRARGYASSTFIYAGPYISHLTRRLGILTPDTIVGLADVSITLGTVGVTTMNHIGLIRRIDGVYQLFGHDDQIWVEPVPTTAADGQDDDIDQGIEDVEMEEQEERQQQ